MSENLSGLSPYGGWRFSSFRHTIEQLIAQTVRVQTNDSAFWGKLASVETTFITLAHATSPKMAPVGSNASLTSTSHHRCHLIYIPFRHINAVTTL